MKNVDGTPQIPIGLCTTYEYQYDIEYKTEKVGWRRTADNTFFNEQGIFNECFEWLLKEILHKS
ncbi:hypothetical protein GCM10023093_00920 [Nemorincola caseinilytica]|uniref:Uncharacterized protein n=1 Tax=Nemorincola caseinilytica TaxID=2054315 RepID=A0ABP8N1D9_9BACT